MQTRRNGMSAAKAAGGVLAVLMLAVPVFAVDIIDDPMQIDERAAQVVQATNSLCWEMHRYHQQQPDYRQSYRAAKEIWSRAGELRDALRAGRAVETEVLLRQVTEMNETFAQVEKTLSKWGPGDRSSAAPNGGPGQRTVVTPGAEIDIPFFGGVRVGGPQVVVTDDGPPQLERRRLHPNSRGSKRSLERELAAAKVALSYLVEDAGVSNQPNSAAPGAPAASGPVPQPPVPDSGLGEPQKIVPPSTKKPGLPTVRK
ncbi:MAG: hypothetical protein HY290_15755 [Planctomycetia bacterium]|nr:hypothetical protein [Planctomycetia bacterium]